MDPIWTLCKKTLKSKTQKSMTQKVRFKNECFKIKPQTKQFINLEYDYSVMPIHNVFYVAENLGIF